MTHVCSRVSQHHESMLCPLSFWTSNCKILLFFLDPCSLQDEGTAFIRNAWKRHPSDRASHPRRRDFWAIEAFLCVKLNSACLCKELFSTFSGSWPPLTGLRDHTYWTPTVSTTPLDERSARCRDADLTALGRDGHTSTIPQASGRRLAP
jgi:hypothetical protein